MLSCGVLNMQRSNLTQNCDVDAMSAARNIHGGLASLSPVHRCTPAAPANAPVDIFGQNLGVNVAAVSQTGPTHLPQPGMTPRLLCGDVSCFYSVLALEVAH